MADDWRADSYESPIALLEQLGLAQLMMYRIRMPDRCVTLGPSVATEKYERKPNKTLNPFNPKSDPMKVS